MRKNWLSILGFLFFAMLFLFGMYVSYRQNPYDPTLSGTMSYGGNPPFKNTLILVGIEVAVWYLIIRPWSFNHSVWRVVIALLVFVPWLGVSVLEMMHAGSVAGTHLFWIFSVCVVLLLMFVMSLIGRRENNKGLE